MTETGTVHDDAFKHLPPRKLRTMETVHLPDAQPLGQLAWWRVIEPTASYEAVVGLYRRYGLGAAPPPPSLGDVFRRETGPRVKAEYQLSQQVSVKLHLHEVRTGEQRYVRDVVRTATWKNRNQPSIDKVGTLAYDGKADQVDLGLEQAVMKLPDRLQIETFVLDVKRACDEGRTHVDAQAGRRLVRRYLAVAHAVLFDGGPYFIPREQDAQGLMDLLDVLGGSTGFHTPLRDGEQERALLAGTVAANELPAKAVGLYRALLGRTERK